jgi:putative transcriptional regulator
MSTPEKWGFEMKGRINWALIRSRDQDTIDKIAAEEYKALGIRFEDLKFRRVPSTRVPNVKAIRAKLGLSQREFARRFSISQRTLQQWEQGRSKPDQPARVLLRVIEIAPLIAERAAGGQLKARKRPAPS